MPDNPRTHGLSGFDFPWAIKLVAGRKIHLIKAARAKEHAREHIEKVTGLLLPHAVGEVITGDVTVLSVSPNEWLVVMPVEGDCMAFPGQGDSEFGVWNMTDAWVIFEMDSETGGAIRRRLGSVSVDEGSYVFASGFRGVPYICFCDRPGTIHILVARSYGVYFSHWLKEFLHRSGG